MIVVAWTSWWHEYRLALAAHAIDIIALLAAVYLSEIQKTGFNSPYPTITAFLLASAALRWGWTGVAWTALGLTALSASFGVGFYMLDLGIDPYRFGRRLMYFGVFAITMVWLSAEQRTMRAVPMPKTPGNAGERRTAVLIDMLAFARTTLHGSGAAIAVSRGEEPWYEVLQDTGAAVVFDRIGPNALEGSFGEPNCAALIDLPRARRIVAHPRTFPVAVTGAFAAPLAAHCKVDEALLVDFDTAAGPGQLLVWGIPDMCVDDLPLAEAMGRHLSTELDRENMAEMAQAASAALLRDALARDLHDSVAQFLAGTLFRLEALTRLIREGHDPISEVLDLKTALRREQGELRATIQRLRRGEEGDRRTDLVEELETLLGEMGHHWRLAVRLDCAVRPLPVSIGMAHELRQVLREAAANAARHGKCREMVVAVAFEEAQITLTIADDGQGFGRDEVVRRPRSISERVEALGGTIKICDNTPGVLLTIVLPHRNEQ
ncbi:MAG: sensor histidine kinase [Novosphingobium sp.]